MVTAQLTGDDSVVELSWNMGFWFAVSSRALFCGRIFERRHPSGTKPHFASSIVCVRKMRSICDGAALLAASQRMRIRAGAIEIGEDGSVDELSADSNTGADEMKLICHRSAVHAGLVPR
jgi:hypothetical protein